MTLDEKELGKVARDLVAKRGKASPETLATLAGLLALAAGANPILAGAGAGLTQAFAAALAASTTQKFLAAGQRWDDEQQLIERIVAHLQTGAQSYAVGDWVTVLEVVEVGLSRVTTQADENLAALAKVVIAQMDRSVDAVGRVEDRLIEIELRVQQLGRAAGQRQQPLVVGHVENLYFEAQPRESGEFQSSQDLDEAAASADPRASHVGIAQGRQYLSDLVRPVKACVTGNKQLLQFCAIVGTLFAAAGFGCGFAVPVIARAAEGRTFFATTGSLVGLCGALALFSFRPDLPWVAGRYLRGRTLLAEMLRALGLETNGEPVDDLVREADAFIGRCQQRCTHG